MVFRGGGERNVFRGERGKIDGVYRKERGKDRVQKREWEKGCCLEGEGKEERMC